MFRMGRGDQRMRGGQWVSLGVELIDQDQESGRSDIRLQYWWFSGRAARECVLLAECFRGAPPLKCRSVEMHEKRVGRHAHARWIAFNAKHLEYKYTRNTHPHPHSQLPAGIPSPHESERIVSRDSGFSEISRRSMKCFSSLSTHSICLL